MFEGVVLGIIQGLTEFLPVSSSGHLTIFQALLGMKDPDSNLTLSIILHSGTMLAVMLYFRADLLPYFSLKGWQSLPHRKIAGLIFAASVPTAIIGLGFKKTFETLFASPQIVCLALLVTAALLYLADRRSPGTTESGSQPAGDLALAALPLKSALIIGIAQGIAITPGISRSGSTIATAMLLGVAGPDAAKFSFLLMIPAVGGATLLEAKKLFKLGLPAELDITGAVAGGIFSFITGLFALGFLMYILREQKLRFFSYYLVIFAAIAFIALRLSGAAS